MAELPLTRGKVALLDDDDLERAQARCWHAYPLDQTWYAASYGHERRVLLHRFVLEAPPRWEVDHINGDGLDNRRANLRLATRQQNAVNKRLYCSNTSGYRGVTWHGRAGRWRAATRVLGKFVHLGFFDDPREAACAYDDFMWSKHGSYAALNVPERYRSFCFAKGEQR